WDVTCLIRQPTRTTLELADTSPQRAPSFSAISSSLLAIVRLVLGSARRKSWRLLQRNERLDLSSITSGPVFRNCEGSEKRSEEGGSESCWSPDREYIQPCSTASIGYVVIRLSWRLPRLRRNCTEYSMRVPQATIAQTEGRDVGDPSLYQSKAEDVARLIRTLLPRNVFLVSDGEYGRCVATELMKTLGRRKIVVLDGKKLKPQTIINSVIRNMARNS